MRFFLPLLLASSVSQAEGVFAELDWLASSEPVPLHSMLYGWDSSFQGGDNAYADLQRRLGFEFDVGALQAHIAWQQREYYALRFNAATARFYRDLEQGDDHQGEGRLQLAVEQFRSEGLRLGVAFDVDGWRLEPRVSLFQISDFQFGQLRGVIRDGQASSTLDYAFNDDKILDYQADVPTGQGASLDLAVSKAWQQWRLDFEVRDGWNRLWLQDAAFTEGCINFGDAGTRVCNSDGLASGRSGQRDRTERIASRYQLALAYQDWQLQLLHHDRYQRLGVRKHWRWPGAGKWLTALYTDKQWQLGWQGTVWQQRLQVSVLADDIRPHFVRQTQLQLAWSYQW
ncbi:hypothetical protein GCM10011297_28630 [Bacterioplanes sanyensis]|uniref:hypothetical protein n=1 Tax=Bacterioplanes sanyensis TaxID=1249553 RepID=UPI00167A1FD6|nr:hypothetical protein [Bacterioplanes sanyensis]GGY54059.1 hypothetical protein GCM10011297_28630 [Bacterioplanes sanyensis]